ncbi:unnamed protein product [Acanthoscelides obtectus]|uniref:Secreted protein n=1 Tax=Acanthoscelides obtectus TaxID=200917 RepID=A0A9P0PNL0_ACAOB|nr:unnamed protein product [Acanthoscelides obtectus]CAK1635651.1 hypothetical protein AOBTE_LOCUS9418 [Acanthoscelides obtectus]
MIRCMNNLISFDLFQLYLAIVRGSALQSAIHAICVGNSGDKNSTKANLGICIEEGGTYHNLGLSRASVAVPARTKSKQPASTVQSVTTNTILRYFYSAGIFSAKRASPPGLIENKRVRFVGPKLWTILLGGMVPHRTSCSCSRRRGHMVTGWCVISADLMGACLSSLWTEVDWLECST